MSPEHHHVVNVNQNHRNPALGHAQQHQQQPKPVQLGLGKTQSEEVAEAAAANKGRPSDVGSDAS